MISRSLRSPNPKQCGASAPPCFCIRARLQPALSECRAKRGESNGCRKNAALKGGLQPLRNGSPDDRRLPNVVRDDSKKLRTVARSHRAPNPKPCRETSAREAGDGRSPGFQAGEQKRQEEIGFSRGSLCQGTIQKAIDCETSALPTIRPEAVRCRLLPDRTQPEPSRCRYGRFRFYAEF